jgi:hypothetical protein
MSRLASTADVRDAIAIIAFEPDADITAFKGLSST